MSSLLLNLRKAARTPNHLARRVSNPRVAGWQEPCRRVVTSFVTTSATFLSSMLVLAHESTINPTTGFGCAFAGGHPQPELDT